MVSQADWHVNAMTGLVWSCRPQSPLMAAHGRSFFAVHGVQLNSSYWKFSRTNLVDVEATDRLKFQFETEWVSMQPAIRLDPIDRTDYSSHRICQMIHAL